MSAEIPQESYQEFQDSLQYLKPELKKLLIIANADFDHTMPIFTFPIGEKGHMRVSEAGKVTLTIETH